MNSKKVEISVGLFLIFAFLSLLFISLKVADISTLSSPKTYRVYAVFDNIGGLKARSPIKIGGVVIGRIGDITLDEKTFLPKVALDIDEAFQNIPETSSLSIRTSGLLGEQFIAVAIGFEDEEMGVGVLKPGDTIQDTKPAMVLEDLIGQFLYKSDTSSAPQTQEPSHTKE